jgi:hypothetical protein
MIGHCIGMRYPSSKIWKGMKCREIMEYVGLSISDNNLY